MNMLRLSSLIFLSAIAFNSFAQLNDLVVYADDGAKFTLLVDGDQKNATPATRVVATGIRTATPRVIIRFEESGMAPLNKALYFEQDLEYTMVLTTNKKGERVLRPTGQAPLGTAAHTPPPAAEFREDVPSSTATIPATGQTTTTTTIVQQVDGDTDPVGMRMDVVVPGISMNVNIQDGMGGTSTTTTTTTTTTTHNSTTTQVQQDPALIIDRRPVTPAPEVYNMPGYTGNIGCAWPMTGAEFDAVKKSLESKGFEDSKMTMAKQVGSNRCFTVDQVKGIMGLFSFEDSRLDFAKYAFERTYDIDNYFKVNDAFSFESSIDDLNQYIMAR